MPSVPGGAGWPGVSKQSLAKIMRWIFNFCSRVAARKAFKAGSSLWYTLTSSVARTLQQTRQRDRSLKQPTNQPTNREPANTVTDMCLSLWYYRSVRNRPMPVWSSLLSFSFWRSQVPIFSAVSVWNYRKNEKVNRCLAFDSGKPSAHASLKCKLVTKEFALERRELGSHGDHY